MCYQEIFVPHYLVICLLLAGWIVAWMSDASESFFFFQKFAVLTYDQLEAPYPECD